MLAQSKHIIDLVFPEYHIPKLEGYHAFRMQYVYQGKLGARRREYKAEQG